MKIDHLTFGQLLKLHSSHNLMRVTMAYHRALRRRWHFWNDGAAGSRLSTDAGRSAWISEAEKRFPQCAAHWKKVLDFLRSTRLRHALREAADAYSVNRHPGYATHFRTVRYYTAAGEKTARALAHLTRDYINDRGIPAEVARGAGGTFLVLVETDEAGCRALIYKTGVRVAELRRYCRVARIEFSDLFWWIPPDTDDEDKVNPCAQPVNTPEVNAISAEFIWKEKRKAVCA